MYCIEFKITLTTGTNSNNPLTYATVLKGVGTRLESVGKWSVHTWTDVAPTTPADPYHSYYPYQGEAILSASVARREAHMSSLTDLALSMRLRPLEKRRCEHWVY